MKNDAAYALEDALENYLKKLEPNDTETLTLIKEYLERCSSAISSVHNSGGAGLEVAALRTIAIDRLICALFDLAGREFCLKYRKSGQSCTIVALGGYGRAELSPLSDIDIMFLYPWKVGPYAETIIERVLYILWDTGLDIGYSTRNIDDCVKVSSDLVIKTSLVDSRFICGDETLYGDYKKALGQQVFSKNIESFIRDKVSEGDERKSKYGGSVYILEPDIKEGDGGLRDLHTALWAAKTRFKVDDFKGLNRTGIISDREYRDLSNALDFMTRIRNDLHFLMKRKSDRLTFALQEKIAINMGYKDEGETLAVEHMMKEYYLIANNIKELSELIVERCLNWGKRGGVLKGLTSKSLSHGFKLFKGELTVPDKNFFKKSPSMIMKLFELSRLHGVPVHSFAKECVRESLGLIDDQFRASEEVNRSFVNILKGEWDVAGTLKFMHKLEVLGRYLPEFGDIRCQVQHDIYHIYTVDTHSLFAVKELRKLALGDYREKYPVKTELMEELEYPEVLYLAALLHDVGKGKGGKHEEIGAEIAEKAGARIGFTKKQVGDLKFLVLKHLRLSHTAQRRDLHDPVLILDFAQEMESLERLKMLSLLTFADIKAIGPDVWNEWKSSLFLDLYTKTAEVFEKGIFEVEDQTEKVALTRSEVKELVSGEYPESDVEAFLESMPDRYFLSTTPSSISGHLRVSMRFKPPLYLDMKHNEKKKYTRLILATIDSPGLFAKICGVMSANAISILGAQIYSRTGGEVLDIFHLKSDKGGTVSGQKKWEEVENDLLDVIQGVKKVEDVLAKRQTSILDDKYTPQIKPRVVINNEISDANTVIEVYAEDCIGLLYAMTSTIFNCGLYIDVAKISTMGEQVTDVFYVKDIFGQKIFFEEKLEEIKNSLLKAVEAVTCSR
ncbi:MAG: [protein-PII] uridylyltransferase [Proteobacteria bacterium]|nr:[protein-PII] uridylyltransferase [Pseudomonadota bacterium]